MLSHNIKLQTDPLQDRFRLLGDKIRKTINHVLSQVTRGLNFRK